LSFFNQTSIAFSLHALYIAKPASYGPFIGSARSQAASLPIRSPDSIRVDNLTLAKVQTQVGKTGLFHVINCRVECGFPPRRQRWAGSGQGRVIYHDAPWACGNPYVGISARRPQFCGSAIRGGFRWVRRWRSSGAGRSAPNQGYNSSPPELVFLLMAVQWSGWAGGWGKPARRGSYKPGKGPLCFPCHRVLRGTGRPPRGEHFGLHLSVRRRPIFEKPRFCTRWLRPPLPDHPDQ